MPLVRIDLITGSSPEELERLCDTLHEAIVAAFIPMGWAEQRVLFT